MRRLDRAGRLHSLVLAAAVVTAGLVATGPRVAHAFPGHHGFHHAHWHGGFGFGHCGFGRFGGPVWGGFGAPCWPLIGNVSFGTGFACGGTRFWSGTTIFGVPAWNGFGGCGPVWTPAWGPVCGPVWGVPAWGGFGGCGPGWFGGGWVGPRWGGVGAWYGGWNPGPGWGWNPGPAWGWNPGPARGWAIPFATVAPAFPRPGLPVTAARPQPFGAPAFGLAAIQGPRTVRASRTILPTAPGAAERLGGPPIDTAIEVAIRTSNAPARARAARLVAVGDRHLRAAIDEPSKLAKAIDAYRRAATIAPDQPDTFLRQAIAFTAAGKPSSAATAVARAVAIEPRLAEDAADDRGGGTIIAPHPAVRSTPLVTRSSKLLSRIFATPESERNASSDNWIARRWQGREAGAVLVAARP